MQAKRIEEVLGVRIHSEILSVGIKILIYIIFLIHVRTKNLLPSNPPRKIIP